MHVARTLVEVQPHWFTKPADSVSPALRGKPAVLNLTDAVLGVTRKHPNLPPAFRKPPCLYLDKDGEWVLSDIIPLKSVDLLNPTTIIDCSSILLFPAIYK